MVVEKYKKKTFILLLIIFLLAISIAYAALNTNLQISGTSVINNASWNIHLENIQVTTGSVTASTPAALDTPRTTVSYAVTLQNPGDFYEFTVDAKNDGSINAVIDTVSSKLNGVEITTLPAYLNYSVTYSNGDAIASNQTLQSNTKKTYKVRVEFRSDIEAGDLPSTAQTLNFSFSVIYKQGS